MTKESTVDGRIYELSTYLGVELMIEYISLVLNIRLTINFS